MRKIKRRGKEEEENGKEEGWDDYREKKREWRHGVLGFLVESVQVSLLFINYGFSTMNKCII